MRGGIWLAVMVAPSKWKLVAIISGLVVEIGASLVVFQILSAEVYKDGSTWSLMRDLGLTSIVAISATLTTLRIVGKA